MNRRKLGKEIQVLRIREEMTQKEVAKESGLTAPFLSKLERGEGNPTLNTLEKIADALSISVSELLAQAESTE